MALPLLDAPGGMNPAPGLLIGDTGQGVSIGPNGRVDLTVDSLTVKSDPNAPYTPTAPARGIVVNGQLIITDATDFYPLILSVPSGGGGMEWQLAGSTQWNNYMANTGQLYFYDGTNNIITLNRGAGAGTFVINADSSVSFGGAINAAGVINVDAAAPGLRFGYNPTAAGTGAAPTLPASTPTGATGGALKYISVSINGTQSWLLAAQ